MHIAVLITNTDESPFAEAHPKDDEKFTQLMHLVRPDWQISPYWVAKGHFPENICAFDGLIIGGSPASVLDGDDWIQKLLETIGYAFKSRIPMFGACFGHQAIALALGGKVEPNPDGWAFGLIEVFVEQKPEWYHGPDHLLQYGAHREQVTKLPKKGRLIFSTAACEIAGFAIGDHVYTSQNHPEMSHHFTAALIDEYASILGETVALKARNSLNQVANTKIFAESMAGFFEMNS